MELILYSKLVMELISIHFVQENSDRADF